MAKRSSYLGAHTLIYHGPGRYIRSLELGAVTEQKKAARREQDHKAEIRATARRRKLAAELDAKMYAIPKNVGLAQVVWPRRPAPDKQSIRRGRRGQASEKGSL